MTTNLTQTSTLTDLLPAALTRDLAALPKTWGRCRVCQEPLGTGPIRQTGKDLSPTGDNEVVGMPVAVGVTVEHEHCTAPPDSNRVLLDPTWRAIGGLLPNPTRSDHEHLPVLFVNISGDHTVVLGAVGPQHTRQYPASVLDQFINGTTIHPAGHCPPGTAANVSGAACVLTHDAIHLTVGVGMGGAFDRGERGMKVPADPPLLHAVQEWGGALVAISTHADVDDLPAESALGAFLNEPGKAAHTWATVVTPTP